MYSTLRTPRSSHPESHSSVFTFFFVQFESELIALARRCITLHLSLSRCVCVPCRTRRAFSLSFSLYSPAAALRPPVVAFPRCVYRTSPCAPTRRYFPAPYISAASPVRTVFHSCRCHVTRTSWSRAFAASSSLLRTPHTPTYHTFHLSLAND